MKHFSEFTGVQFAPANVQTDGVGGALTNNLSVGTKTLTIPEGGTLDATDGNVLGVISPKNPNTLSSYNAFGDSITAGFDASSPQFNYVSLIGSYLNLTPVNHGVSGSACADQFQYIYPTVVSETGSPLFTFMIGTNDAFLYPVSLQQANAFKRMNLAASAYLAIPASKKTLGQSALSYSGTWVNSSDFGGSISKRSTTNASSATFSCYGSVIYLAYMIGGAANGGSFSISVDGVLTTSISVKESITTLQGTQTGSALLRLDGLSKAPHTIVVTVTSSTDAANIVQIDWVGSPYGSRFTNGPTVIIAGPPQQGSPSGYIAQARRFNGYVRENAAILASDGLPVFFADSESYIIPSTDLIVDGVHPNDLGFQHLFDAFIASINASNSITYSPLAQDESSFYPYLDASSLNYVGAKGVSISGDYAIIQDVDCTLWVRFSCYSLTAQRCIFGGASGAPYLSVNTSGNLVFGEVGGAIIWTSKMVTKINNFYEVLLTKTSGLWNSYVNGVFQFDSFPDSKNWTVPISFLGCMGPANTDSPFFGVILSSSFAVLNHSVSDSYVYNLYRSGVLQSMDLKHGSNTELVNQSAWVATSTTTVFSSVSPDSFTVTYTPTDCFIQCPDVISVTTGDLILIKGTVSGTASQIQVFYTSVLQSIPISGDFSISIPTDGFAPNSHVFFRPFNANALTISNLKISIQACLINPSSIQEGRGSTLVDGSTGEEIYTLPDIGVRKIRQGSA